MSIKDQGISLPFFPPSIPHLTLLIMQYIHYRCCVECFMFLHKIYFGHKLSETNSASVNLPHNNLLKNIYYEDFKHIVRFSY